MDEKYYDSEEFRDVLKTYEESEKTGESHFFDSSDLLDIADYYCLHGKISEARTIVDNVLETFPSSDEALMMKSRMCLTYDHSPDKAELIADMVSDKQDVDYIYLMVEIMLSRGKDEEAEEWLEKVYEESDDDELETIAEEIARIYVDYNNMEMAEKWLERCDDNESQSKKELKARILINNGKIEESQAIINKLIDEDPYNTFYWNLLASTQFVKGDMDEVITSSEYCLAINPNDEEAIMYKANGLYQLGNYDDAIVYFKQFSKLRPDEEVGDMMIGICMIAQNRLQEGVEYLKKAEKKNVPDSPHTNELYQELIMGLCKLNHFDEALDYLKNSEDKDCDHNEIKVLEGFVMMSKGDYDAGKDCFQKALKDSGYSPMIYLKIGIALYECHLYTAAYLTTKSLIDICPDDVLETYAFHALFSLHANHEDEYQKYRKMAFEKDEKSAASILGDFEL